MLFNLPTENASKDFAKSLAKFLVPGLVITFSGEIGMGKTTIIRFLLQFLGIVTSIKSPTFSLVESYLLDLFQLHHFDLYRINDESELEYIGFRDYFNSTDICIIEWPEKLGSYPLAIDLEFQLVRQEDGRDMYAKALNARGLEVLNNLNLIKDFCS